MESFHAVHVVLAFIPGVLWSSLWLGGAVEMCRRLRVAVLLYYVCFCGAVAMMIVGSWRTAGVSVRVARQSEEIARLLAMGGPVLAALAGVSAEAHMLREKAKRIRTNHCIECDYDMTGNTTGVCPECGKAAEM